MSKKNKKKELQAGKEPEKKAEEVVTPRGNKPFENHIVITKSEDSRAKWYVVHTYSGHEVKVLSSLRQRVAAMKLEQKILEALIPTQERIQIRAGRKHQITEKMFPGYLLVRMILDDESWLAVRTTEGVTGFIGVGNKPTPIADNEVEVIEKFMAMEAPKFKAKFTVGEAVKIVDGPFAEFLGSIESIDEERGKVKVLVSIFGRETPVELDFLQVKKI